MRIIVSGASGFVARAFSKMAKRRGHEVLQFSRRPLKEPSERNVVGALSSAPWGSIREFAPDAVVHLAWIATPGVYLHSRENERLLEESQQFLGQCAENGIRHLAGVGTCVEYAASDEPLCEDCSALAPNTPYARAKTTLYHWLKSTCAASGQPWSWFRIFYPYGPGEHPGRLPSSIMRQLAAGQRVHLRTPNSIKDYVFIDDLARGLCMSLEQSQTGPINLGSGDGISIRSLGDLCAVQLGVSPELVSNAEPPTIDPYAIQIADVTRLRATGWAPETSLEEGLRKLAHALTLPGEAPRAS